MPVAQLVNIEIVGLRDALGRFARWEQELTRATRAAMRDTARQAQSILREAAPRGQRLSGDNGRPHLADTIQFRTSDLGGGSMSAEVYVPSSMQALLTWIRRGTSAHIITARRARFLRFYWPNGPRGAGIYYFRSVRHPGTNPNDFVERSMGQIQQLAYNNWSQRVAQVFVGIGDI